MSGFVHLHVHSEYSLLDGAARVEALVDTAAKHGMKALALTDHGVMYGVVPFYKACMARGIQPIIGCEAYITSGSRLEKGNRTENPTFHLILLAKNEQGYQNLMKLVSLGHLEGFHYKPRIDMESLRTYSEGIICLSACLGGDIPQHLLHGRYEDAKEAALSYRDIFGDDFYLELQDHGIAEQKRVNPLLMQISEETGIPLVVTNDAHYVAPEDAAMQDVLICIGTGKTVEDEDRLRIASNQLYLKSGEEMERLFSYVPEALRNTEVIASKCADFKLALGQSILPAFQPIPNEHTATSYLAWLCAQGLERRYAALAEWQEASYQQRVRERLTYELGVIERMGYSDYFLIVWDFIRYAHEQGIATGPGRGSSAGSLVAYVLNITDVDPIKYKLLFERFLNPARITMPDIDIDFSDLRRDEVISYVVDKYGSEHVAQIITFGTMAARAAVRDVGRVLNLPFGEVDRVAKMIPNHLGVTIDEALQLNAELRQLAERNERVFELIEMAKKVEGMPRHASTHAAGIVISEEPLTHYVPLQAGSDASALTQYSMENLEAIGLLKMDFLGLRTLSIIERTLAWVQEHRGIEVRFQEVPDDDALTYEMLSLGNTTGVFQLESAGMRRVLKELKPSQFEDIVSVLALYRPGPMEFIPKYIQGKHGEIAVEYPHESLIPILEDTYGIIVYQEQIMQIASQMAGFSLGEADLLRRAVSKKKREVLDEERAHFVKGSVGLGFTADDANVVYDMIVRFADYGFPRAHAAAYGVLAFQTAYLKAHYPVEFMSSMLASVMGNHRKVAEYVDASRHMEIEVLPPDVNESGTLFTPVKKEDGSQAIRFGLAAMKNVGTQAIESIMKERKERHYDSLLDFCRRVDLRVCNKRVIESLIQGGAFDSLPGHRAQLAAMLDETVDAAVKWRKEREDLQIQLFGFVEVNNWTIAYPDIRPYTSTQQLEFERELLGLYISGHPLDEHEVWLSELPVDRFVDLEEAADESEVIVAGMVVAVKQIATKKGQMMGFMDLEDRVDRAEVVLFPRTWERYHGLVDKGALLAVRGKLQQQDEGFKLLADDIAPLERGAVEVLLRRRRPQQQARREPPAAAQAGGASAATRARAARGAAPAQGAAPPPHAAAAGGSSSNTRAGQRVYIKIGAGRETAPYLEQLKALLQEHRGPMQTVLFYERDQKAIALSEGFNTKPSPVLFRQVEALLGEGTVRVK